MSKGLTLTRSAKNNEILFFIEDSNGNTIPIKQTFSEIVNGQVRVLIDAPNNVKILRGELLK